MKVLSLFDWMACWYEALIRAWIKIDAYYASEIDKYAIQIAMKNHPDIIQVWDVTKLKGEDFKDIDLLIGWSPCQGFSMAWKMLNFNDPRSALFFEFVRLLKEIRPKYFLLENVKMKKEFSDKISEIMWCEPIEINSALVSAQNRKRLYWTNIPWITQPEDKGILLKDVLEENVDEKYYLSQEQLERISGYWIWRNDRAIEHISTVEDEKIWTITAHCWTMSNTMKLIKTPCWTQLWNSKKFWNSYSEKAYTLRASNPNGVILDGKQEPLVSMRGGELRIRQATKQWYIVANEWDGISLAYPNSTTRRGRVTKGKSNTLMVSWDSYVVQKVWDRDKNNRWVHEDKSYCLPANPMSDRWQMVVQWGWKVIRKLTPVECERLQTMPDNYTEWVSDTQRYKMLWNWWTVDVISHIFSFIK